MSSDDGVIKGIASSIAGVLSWGLLDKPATSLKEADVIAQKLVKRWVAATASVSWVPGSTFVLMGMDYRIYKDIATAYGVETFDIDAVKTSILATIAGRGASEALSFVVGVGWVVKAGVAAGITGIVGEVVISFMRERSPLKA